MATAASRRPPGRAVSNSPRAAADASLKQAPRKPVEKSLGEFSSIPTQYMGSYKPARVGLRRALDAGRMRDPLAMTQSHAALWSEQRPATAGSAASRPPSRPQSGSRAPRGPTDRLPEKHQVMHALGNQALSTERGPEVLRPQRIELPSYLNTPVRRPDAEPPGDQERTLALKKIQDLELITQACKRASKARDEGRAHFSLGVLRDNLGQYQKAIESYNSFLRVCKEYGDTQGCGLAYHCIGVDHQLLAGGLGGGENGGAPGSPGGGSSHASIKPEMLRKAIFYHNKHREGGDSVGKFVSHLNMGLAYALLGEREAATVNHQYALRYALQLHSLEGQSLAIGSLGFSASMYDHDAGKMSTLIERYIELCGALGQPRNKGSALQKLGTLAGQQGDNDKSADYFRQAMDAARARGDVEAELGCSVQVGVAEGQARMEAHLSRVLEQAIVHGRGSL